MKFNAVIFDLDGTLINTIEDIADAFNRVLRKSGYPTHQTEEYKYLVGDGARNAAKYALPEDSRDDAMVERLLSEYIDDYKDNWDNKTVPYEGVVAMLNQLSDLGIKTAVFSNKPHANTLRCVNGFFPDYNFDVVLGQSDDRPRKPDPAGAVLIAEQMGITVDKFLFLGDTSVDVKTALAAGMMPVGAQWGYRDEKELRDAGAEMIISRPEELLGLV